MTGVDAAVIARLESWTADRVAERLWAKDGSLWAASGKPAPDVAAWLGWLDLPQGMSERVSELEHLEKNQWRNVWGTIADFHFIVDELQSGVSGDGLQAWAVVPWTSTGFHEDGTTFDRPGRATVVFTRNTADGPWRAIHTHISLAPGTPQRSFGR